MKHRLSVSIILSLFLCIFTSSIYAYEGLFNERQRVINETLNQWELGIEISHITYKEPGVMKEDGVMYGVVGSYTCRGWVPPAPEALDKWMFKVEGRFSFGEVDYKNSGTIDDIEDYMLEFRGLGGYDFFLFEASTLTPYIGIGYRYLNDDMSGKISSTGAAGYERESYYFYSPVGIEIITPLENGWSVWAAAEYDIFWLGRQKSHLSDVDPGYNDPKNRQKRGYGLRGSIKLQKKGKKLDFVIEPFIRYWNIKRSKYADLTYYGVLIGYAYEPKNNSTEFGLKLAVRF